MNFFRSAVIAAIVGACAVGCDGTRSPAAAPAEEPIKVGGLYAEKGEDGKWRMAKVLALDDRAVHLRLYANTFDEQPTEIDPSQLTLGGIEDPAGTGIGHLPMAKSAFLAGRVLVQIEPVAEEELEGFRLYQEATKPHKRKQESRPPK